MLCSDNGEVLHEWCLAGLGISLCEIWDVHEELHNGQLVPVLPDWEGVASKISLVRARREPVPHRLTVFSDFLLERWQQTPWEHWCSLLPFPLKQCNSATSTMLDIR
ncbi:LysR substrate-binding domain-containing protein [Yersinia sp. 2541 StPb PI]|uniref:LysR substrate-binding domain-containing protein n=1 Tax=Yersinia sp. 2541 StPb PI TaxID=3117407 RepID=UPI003FA49FF4